MYLRQMTNFQHSVNRKERKSGFNLNSSIANFEFLVKENSFENIREMQLYQERLKSCLDNVFKICKIENLTRDQRIRILKTFSFIQKNPNSKGLGMFYRIKINIVKYSLTRRIET